MSAFGTKWTCQSRSAMSAFGGKADMTRTFHELRDYIALNATKTAARVTVADERLAWPKKLNVSFW